MLTRFARRDGAALPKILVVCPLSGHFSILLRDLVIGLLPTFDVFITDWINARHVPVRHGSFNLEANNSYVATMMEYLGPALNVIALCQAAIPALAATAYLAAKSTRAGPRTLVLIAAPVDPDANPTPVDRLIRSRSLDWYKRNVISEVPAAYAGRRRAVYSGSIQLL
ncbi:MAG: polyhydroxyalkanoate depolymerase, partial [Hyphomicrobium sp.]|nr:polyhydroxyalkanoate depolymerase [Hyphomicrobium sp.]